MSTLAETEKSHQKLSHLAGKYLTFELDAETYGLPILNVQEIIGILPVTRVPRTPAFVRGVINLRGRVIPVIALRRKFEMEDKDDDEKTCIIVVQISVDDCELTVGIIVDEVSEVLQIREDQLETRPEFGTNVNMDFILGVGKVEKRIVMLLDTNRILSTSELGATAKAARIAGSEA